MVLVKIEIIHNDFQEDFYVDEIEVTDVYENIRELLNNEFDNKITTSEDFDDLINKLNVFHTFYYFEGDVEKINLKLI
jgi:hypothetical protein